MAGLISVTSSMFFNRQGIIGAMDRKTHKVLGATGAFTRTYLQRQMRYSPKVSKPGAYPHSHDGRLRKKTYFGFDTGGQQLVVGPELFSPLVNNKTVPQLVNEGGRVARRVKHKTGRVRRVTQRYRPRPFVNLTLPIAAHQLADNMEKINL